jgi:hypothetical protein
MPINKDVTKSTVIDNILFCNDGSVNVTTITSVDGFPPITKTFAISLEAVSGVLDVPYTGTDSIRTVIVSSIYGYLIANGLIDGAIAA